MKKINYHCPIEAALVVIGSKWKGAILFHLLDGTKRFGELKRLIPKVTQRMLVLQLRELEEHGVIERKVYAQVPPKVEYSMTELGRSLKPTLTTLEQWGRKIISENRI